MVRLTIRYQSPRPMEGCVEPQHSKDFGRYFPAILPSDILPDMLSMPILPSDIFPSAM